MTSEVGSGQVAIFPTFRGFKKAVADEVDGAGKDASRGFKKTLGAAGDESGAAAGRGFKKAFAGSSSGAASSTLKQMTDDVAKASAAVAASRLKELDAAGKVRVAEAQLAEARARYGADASQTIRAQERLASVSRGLETVQSATRVATEKLSAAQTALKSSAESAGQSGSFLGRVFQSARGVVAGAADGIRSAFSSSMAAVRQVASDAATVVGNTFKVAGAAVAATLGTALVSGFSRLSSIEDASAKLKGLGNSAESVKVIMANALASVKGTAFGMGEAATVAASAVAAGVKPGAALERYLKLTAGAATAAGISFTEMGAIINKVTTKGAAQMENINQIQDRGIPIMQYLAEAYGVSQLELSKMVSAGQVDAETFQRVLEEKLGKTAEAVGKTTSSTWANMKAGLARLGAAILGGIYPIFADLFSTITVGLDAVTAKIEPFTRAFGENLAARIGPTLEMLRGFFGSMKDAASSIDLSWLSNAFIVLAPAIGAVMGSLGPLLTQLPLIGGVFTGITGPLGFVIGLLAMMFSQSSGLRDAFGGAFEAITGAIGEVFEKLGPVLAQLMPVILDLAKVLGDTLGQAITALVPFVVQIIGVFGDLIAQVLPSLLPLITMLGQFIGKLAAALIPLIATVASALMPVFEALVPVIAKILEAILPVVGIILDALMPIIEALVPVIGVLFEAFAPLITALVEALAPILVTVADIFGAVLGPVLDVTVDIIKYLAEVITWLVQNVVVPYFQNFLIPVIKSVGDIFSDVFGGLGDFLGGVFEGIANNFKGFLNFLIDGINGFIGGLNDAGKFISDITGGSVNFSLGKLPRLARGTNFAPDAFIAGEAGPELITGMRGATVRPYEVTKDILGRGVGGNVYIDKMVVPDQDPRVAGRVFARELVRELAGT